MPCVRLVRALRLFPACCRQARGQSRVHREEQAVPVLGPEARRLEQGDHALRQRRDEDLHVHGLHLLDDHLQRLDSHQVHEGHVRRVQHDKWTQGSPALTA
ncbi:hypothetical protein EGW08_007415 [Elysia chlorotica]|uniref:Uncharacterized protein n=1 Tax=Elysia chlorotica TaxID=188477 RepID=A0A3S1BJ23_ELYCH|nr:hypothetical protein EGW08_007415 [Elysia chlorotica]